MKSRIGIYSGTFDPVHAGHIAFARAAARACRLSEVVFLPERQPREKQQVTPLKMRLSQLETAVAPYPELRVVALKDRQFSVQETLPRLQALFAGAELTLLVGSDVVRTFRYRWEGLELLLRAMPLAIGMRKGDDQAETEAIIKELAAQYKLVLTPAYIHTPHAHLTSSQLRMS